MAMAAAAGSNGKLWVGNSGEQGRARQRLLCVGPECGCKASIWGFVGCGAPTAVRLLFVACGRGGCKALEDVFCVLPHVVMLKDAVTPSTCTRHNVTRAFGQDTLQTLLHYQQAGVTACMLACLQQDLPGS